MMRKTMAALAIGVGIAAGGFAAAGSAAAAEMVPGGVYPSHQSCVNAGNAGLSQHRWVGWRCAPLSQGQYFLWVQPTY
jgi:hypothetical protein